MIRESAVYDYIIAGAGSSGLSLAWYLIHSDLANKRILVVDRDMSPKNDKTWCYWSNRSRPLDELVRKKWRRANVLVNGDHFTGSLSDYPYLCIRNGDYRESIFKELKKRPNVTLLEMPVQELRGNSDKATLIAGDRIYSADYAFQSCFRPSMKQTPEYPLIQHFRGWDITTNPAVFDPDTFTLMDFDESYTGGIAFMYVLPWSDNMALLEYTIFSKTVEPLSEYEKKLELYLFNKYGLKPIDYTIDRREYGEIPMEDSVYDTWYAPRVMNIGVYGGLTKPSTGYTYRRIQDHSEAIADSLAASGRPAPPPRSPMRFRNYDLWLLEIMYDYPEDAIRVFHSLFRHNSFDAIFRFLGEESRWMEDLKIMASVPYTPFFRAIWKTKGRLFKV